MYEILQKKNIVANDKHTLQYVDHSLSFQVCRNLPYLDQIHVPHLGHDE